MDWTQKRVDDLQRLLAAGRTAAEIARKIGTTRNAVIGKSRREGFQFIHSNGKRNRGVRSKAFALCENNRNLTVNEVAAVVGCTPGYIYQLHSHGLPVQVRLYERATP